MLCVSSLRTRIYKQQRCRPLRCSETVREKNVFVVVSFARATFFSHSRFRIARDARASRRRLFFAERVKCARCGCLSPCAGTRKEVFPNRGIEKRPTTRRGNRARDDARVWVEWCRVTLRTIFRRGVSRVRVARARWILLFHRCRQGFGDDEASSSSSSSSSSSHDALLRVHRSLSLDAVDVDGRFRARRSFARASLFLPRLSSSVERLLTFVPLPRSFFTSHRLEDFLQAETSFRKSPSRRGVEDCR